MTKKPSYRFTGYTEVWEEKKLGNLGSVEMCRRIFKEETSAEFEIPFFKIGTFGGEADTYITREKFEEYKTKFAYPQRGDLLLSASGSIGRVVEYDGDEAYYQDSNIVWLNHHGKINNKFLKAFYKIVSWSGIEGTTIKRLYNKNILETDISLPSLSEQTAIGSFFQDIDQLISLQQRKLEVLKEQKKTYLKLLFPAKGQIKPALRFAGFEDDWKEVKLGEVLTERNIQMVPSDQVPLVSFTVENGVTPKTERYNREFLVREESKKYKYTRYNDIVYNPANLKFGAIARNKYGEAVFSPIYVTFEVNYSNILPEFIEGILTSKDFIQQALKFQEGTVYERMAVKADDFTRLAITVPSLPEQEAIGSFFQDLDKAIAKQEEKVNQLKESKQTLLRKMFI
ncbi:restriction endonuclease subunit S [Streptococcus pseudopneumoniae]|uniref:Restriction endonuclease subunit S n=1 Tax=Streptococcus pseudopneumoniae TaxID=257758 RepID=A0ABX9PE64_9STRE|nr:restriction endonuclease subunit S [Streptococcus pseudopneumoniae]RJQ63383.1 restriction endonuclease subunit S [Streptococcus pseudopneumoniae]RJY13037.1 restriction endonuclease subunit S [Streptococcus pseudopneumoniae]